MAHDDMMEAVPPDTPAPAIVRNPAAEEALIMDLYWKTQDALYRTLATDIGEDPSVAGHTGALHTALTPEVQDMLRLMDVAIEIALEMVRGTYRDPDSPVEVEVDTPPSDAMPPA